MPKLAVQLYTLREESKVDFANVIEYVAKTGWNGVEFAGFYGMEAEKLKALLEKHNLVALSSHVGIQMLKDDLQNVMDYHKKIGVTKIVCPFSEVDNLPELLGFLTETRDTLAKNGFELLYHNHEHEYVAQNGVVPIEEIAKIVPLELDAFWAWIAGMKYPEYIVNTKQIKMLHIKDGWVDTSARRGGTPCAIGEGKAPITDMLSGAKQCGAEWIVVENDIPTPNGFEDTKRSYENIWKIIKTFK